MRQGTWCRLLLWFFVWSGCLTAGAFAADLSVRTAPVYTPFTWTGFYAGVNLGYGWGTPQVSSVITAFVESAAGSGASNSAAGTSNSSRSALGGFQVGYNLQVGSWVYGVETDLAIIRLQTAGPPLATSARAFTG